MSNAWPMVKLGEVLRHRKEFFEIDDIAQYKRCRVQLHAKGVVLRDIVVGAEIKTKQQQVCQAGEFLVAEIDAKVGGFGIVPDDLADAIVSSHYFLFPVDEAKLDRRFLDFFIRTPAFREQVTAQGTTNYAAIRPSHVLAYTIPLPPLSEQRRIVAKIEQLASKIEEARGLHSHTGQAAKVLWEAAASSVLNGIPRHLWRPLGSVVEIGGGGTPSKENPLFWSGDIPWISPKDMKQREIRDSIDRITQTALNFSRLKLHAPGTVLVVIRGMILAHTFPSAVLRVPGTINQDMKALNPKNELTAVYLCSVLWGLGDSILAQVDRSGHDTRKLVTPKLESFQIPVPPLPEQRRIVAYLDDLQAKVDQLKKLQAQTAAELDALLPSILDRAFRGEL